MVDLSGLPRFARKDSVGEVARKDGISSLALNSSHHHFVARISE